MGSPAASAIGFIIGTLIGAYALFGPALRFVMQLMRADYFNPVAQTVVKLTDPVLIPMRRVVPSFKRYDTSSLLMAYGVLFLKFLIFKFLPLGAVPAFGMAIDPSTTPITTLFVLTFIDLVNMLFNIFIFSLVIYALMSWFPGAQGNPIQGLLRSITAPLLQPARRFIPPIGDLDLSVFFTIIGLFALQMFVVRSLIGIVSSFS